VIGEHVMLPPALGLLALVPLVWWVLHNSEGARGRRLERLIGPRTRALAGNASTRRRRLRHGLSLAGFTLAVLAVVQPAWGVDPDKVQARGVDVVVCLDVSRSMLAQDLAPDRLGRAHDEIRALTRRAQGDRIGLVAFAGDARLMIPLTRDMDSVDDLVEGIDPSCVGLGGTNIGAALEQALSALEGGDRGHHETILLISDGEDLEGEGLAAAAACAERNITVHTLGLGSTLGSKIALTAEDGGETFLKDRAGNDVVSVLDASGLRAIAEATGGEYVDLSRVRRPLVELYESRILPMAGKVGRGDRSVRKNHFQWPLVLAFFLFLGEFAISERRVRR